MRTVKEILEEIAAKQATVFAIFKEAKTEDRADWGDQVTRAVSWEIMTAVALATAGANLLVMRHPQAVAGVKKALEGFFT